MSNNLLTELRNRLSNSDDLILAIEAQFEWLEGRIDELEQASSRRADTVRHMQHGLRMIAQVQPTEEGARMARGIAEETLSAVGVD